MKDGDRINNIAGQENDRLSELEKLMDSNEFSIKVEVPNEKTAEKENINQKEPKKTGDTPEIEKDSAQAGIKTNNGEYADESKEVDNTPKPSGTNSQNNSDLGCGFLIILLLIVWIPLFLVWFNDEGTAAYRVGMIWIFIYLGFIGWMLIRFFPLNLIFNYLDEKKKRESEKKDSSKDD